MDKFVVKPFSHKTKVTKGLTVQHLILRSALQAGFSHCCWCPHLQDTCLLLWWLKTHRPLMGKPTLQGPFFHVYGSLAWDPQDRGYPSTLGNHQRCRVLGLLNYLTYLTTSIPPANTLLTRWTCYIQLFLHLILMSWWITLPRFERPRNGAPPSEFL